MRLRAHLQTLASPAQSGKAWVAAAVGFFAPIGALLAGQQEITWRTFAAAVVAGIVAGVSVYSTRNVGAGITQPAAPRHLKKE